MRQLSGDLQSKIQQRLGLEPVLVVGVAWDGKTETLYAEKIIEGHGVVGKIPAKILAVQGIDDVMNISGSGSSGIVEITLDDTDGTIKKILDVHDIHLAPVTIYQMFAGAADKFIIYAGQVNTPIVWDEGKRQLQFTAVTVVEDLEVGFAAEEGTYPNLPDAFIGKVWPMCFGSPKHVPTFTFQQVPVGQLMTNVVVPDRTYELALMYMSQMQAKQQQFTSLDAYYMALAAWNGDWDTEQYYANKLIQDQLDAQKYSEEAQQKMIDRINKMRQYMTDESNLRSQLIGPVTEGYTIISNNARWWPVDKKIICKAGDFLLEGTVNKDAVFHFKILQPPIPRMYPWSDVNPQTGEVKAQGIGWIVPSWSEADMYVGPDNQVEPIFRGTPGFGPHNSVLQPGERWADSIEPEGFRVIPAGTSIQIVSDIDMTYIVDVNGGAIDRVWAYRYQNNVRSLAVVPRQYWSQSTFTGGDSFQQESSFKATSLVLKRPLSAYAFEGWEDQIFVDVTSPVSANPGEAMRHLISKYSNKQIDEANWDFQGVSDTGWALMKRGNLLSVLAEIAYQCCHAVFIKNGKFCLTPLTLEPSTSYTLTEDDILVDTMQITCNTTEELITKIHSTFRADYAIDADTSVIVKSNDLRYGVKELQTQYYIYTHTELVASSTTFWIVRKSNSWKKLRFRTTLKHLALETYDAVRLDFTGNWVADGPVTGVVESCTYDSNDNSLEITLWLPIIFGDNVPHPFAWPGFDSKTYTPYVPVGVEVQPKPNFYAGPIKGLVPLIVGDESASSYSRQQTPKDPPRTDAKTASLNDLGSYYWDGWDPATPPDPPGMNRIHVDDVSYDDIFEKPDPEQPGPSTSTFVPGKIVGYGNGVYTVEAYPFGLDGKAYTVKHVTALQVAPDMPFPKDTWVFISKMKSKDGKKTFFYMQPPVWLP